MSGTELSSAGVVVSAPMSFAGSSQRIWHLTRNRAGWAAAVSVILAILLIVLAWALVLCWYVIWGIWLIPYRIIRRGQRKQKLAQIRHQEMMDAWTARNGSRES